VNEFITLISTGCEMRNPGDQEFRLEARDGKSARKAIPDGFFLPQKHQECGRWASTSELETSEKVQPQNTDVLHPNQLRNILAPKPPLLVSWVPDFNFITDQSPRLGGASGVNRRVSRKIDALQNYFDPISRANRYHRR
jgi:hypothetical protein